MLSFVIPLHFLKLSSCFLLYLLCVPVHSLCIAICSAVVSERLSHNQYCVNEVGSSGCEFLMAGGVGFQGHAFFSDIKGPVGGVTGGSPEPADITETLRNTAARLWLVG